MVDPGDGTEYVRIQDPGDPRDYGIPDHGNRKITFTHNVESDGLTQAEADNLIENGVTISFRARLSTGVPPDIDPAYPDGGGGIAPWRADGDGSARVNGGRSLFGVSQDNGALPRGTREKSIAFNLSHPDEVKAALDGYDPAYQLDEDVLVMNINRPDVPNPASPWAKADLTNVDGPGQVNVLGIGDATQWHEFWITIQVTDAGQLDPVPYRWPTQLVRVWKDGALTSDNFLVTAGDGMEYYGDPHILMSQPGTGWQSAFDIDFYSYKPGVWIAPEPTTFFLAAVGLLGLALFGWRRKRAA